MSAGSLPLGRVGAGDEPQTPPRTVTSRFSLQLLLGVPVLAAVVLLVVPLIILLRFSFLLNIPGKGLSDQTTLSNYTVFATDDFFRGSIAVTLVTAVLITVICLVLAFPVAYAYARTSFGPKGLLLIAILS